MFVFFIQVGKRVFLTQPVRQVHAQRHLNALQRQQTQLLVKHVPIHRIVKPRAGLERIQHRALHLHFLGLAACFCIQRAKRLGAYSKVVPITAQSVVANALQIVRGLGHIANLHATGLQLRQLIGNAAQGLEYALCGV